MKKLQTTLALTVCALGLSTQAIAATFTATADTYVYEFLGNQAGGDVLVWNHESSHGARGLMDFNGLDASLSGLSAGLFTATLNLYSYCSPSGFVGACAGYPDADSPGGVATLTTDIFAQNGSWSENDPSLTWSDIQEGTKYGDFTINSSVGQWISADITALVEAWRQAGSTSDGIVLSQEAYPVVRDDDGKIAVAQFHSKDFTDALLHPYIDVQVVPLPAAAWLLGSALIGLVGIARHRGKQS